MERQIKLSSSGRRSQSKHWLIVFGCWLSPAFVCSTALNNDRHHLSNDDREDRPYPIASLELDAPLPWASVSRSHPFSSFRPKVTISSNGHLGTSCFSNAAADSSRGQTIRQYKYFHKRFAACRFLVNHDNFWNSIFRCWNSFLAAFFSRW